MNNTPEYADEEFDAEPIEGYCMHCRESVEMENPIPVWTRKGQPATRGECPICGGQVFRMGKTDAHSAQERPAAVEISDTDSKRKRPRLTKETVYVAYAPADQAMAERIADDLNNVGIAAWLHETSTGSVQWAGGVHPALKECARMVYVLSPDALQAEDVEAAWRFFRENRKPIIIAQVQPAHPPDMIRRSPRFDLGTDYNSSDYKRAFRQMLQALSA